MPKSGSIIGAIGEELGELGKKVVTETAKAPVDIVATVFEKGGGKKTQQAGQQMQGEEAIQKKEKTPLDLLEDKKTEKEKRPIARPVLEYFAQRKEPSVYERKQMEEKEKKEKKKQQAAAAVWQQLPNTGAAPRKGDLRNITKKQAGTETGKNIVNQ